jgi:hypothetical protein
VLKQVGWGIKMVVGGGVWYKQIINTIKTLVGLKKEVKTKKKHTNDNINYHHHCILSPPCDKYITLTWQRLAHNDKKGPRDIVGPCSCLLGSTLQSPTGPTGLRRTPVTQMD